MDYSGRPSLSISKVFCSITMGSSVGEIRLLVCEEIEPCLENGLILVHHPGLYAQKGLVLLGQVEEGCVFMNCRSLARRSVNFLFVPHTGDEF